MAKVNHQETITAVGIIDKQVV